MVTTRRYKRATFASLEQHGEARALLYALGSQLVGDFASRAGQDAGLGWLEVERALREWPTLVVLDNMNRSSRRKPGQPTPAPSSRGC